MKKIICVILGAVLCWSGSVLADTEADKTAPPTPDQKSLWRLGIVYSQIKQFYVEPETDKDLMNGAIAGMLEKLDPHSQYLDQKDFKSLKEMTNGEFGGIGAKLTSDHGILKVISPLDGTPAAKAGIKSGDYIIAIDDKPILDNQDINDAIDKIRGKPGTKVKLTIMNRQDDEPREVTLKREIIEVNSIESRMLDEHYAYIRIADFQKSTGQELKKAILALQKQAKTPLQGIIIDERNNPGGLIDAAVDVSDDFLDDQTAPKGTVVVSTRGRFKEADSSYLAHPQNLLKGVPLVVLINSGSASAAEIVAGALQDLHRAVIVGQRSFGKGSVQTVFPLDKDTAIKLTIARYYTPSGHSIQNEGIQPDILIPDLVLTKKKDDLAFFDKIREADLRYHLENADAKTQNDRALTIANKMARDDFPLYAAYIVVQGLHFR